MADTLSDETWSYEINNHPDGSRRIVISVHHYRLGFASTAEEWTFDTFADAVHYLKDQLNA